MEYNFREIEKKWQQFWAENNTFKVEIDTNKQKYYVLDMFPYPSGAGLHVGHPLGYIASDIISRYKKHKGFNVLHPMGFDSFGLPAEQYAIQTGQHPAITTDENINTFIRQLKNLGFSYDWNREVRTSEPDYYKWTQWIFMQLFNHYYDQSQNKAVAIKSLISVFEKEGNKNVKAVCDEDTPSFDSKQWNAMSADEQQILLLKYRLTFPDDSVVNWCPAMGTVLANDEVKDGVSERGGYPVEQKKMKQWSMRITAYADRLLAGLDTIDWSDSIKEQQRNWIGRSQGASVKFRISDNETFDTQKRDKRKANQIEVFTTRVDTIYGVSFMVLAPEHPFVDFLTSEAQKNAVEAYLLASKARTELDRMAETKVISGVFTGSFCENPFNNEQIPIYLADYVLAGYGTGAVMGVPSGDQRDWNFATHFNLPIIQILDAQKNIEQQADNTKEGKYINSGMIDGMDYKSATKILIDFLEEKQIGKGKIQYRLRNAVFSRQRYWGEPVPVYFKKTEKGDTIPYLIDESDLPLMLPKVDRYLPTPTGEPPLGNAENWKYQPKGQNESYEYELSTMPGWAGSSWYWFRYMDNKNQQELASKTAIDYWQDIDLYMGGAEHATGHLLYSRFWNKFLKDIGITEKEEFAKKLINQGMIQGRSNFVYRLKSSEGEGKNPVFVSFGLKNEYETTALHIDVSMVENDILDIEAFKKWRPDFEKAEFILEKEKYICGFGVEKMSKRLFNVVNPDDVIEKFGADTLRLYEMFLGPLEQSKPWNTNGISGTYNFLRKFWRLFFDENTGKSKVVDIEPSQDEQKILHKTIKKVQEEIERYSFNTVVSTLMIAVNELSDLKCAKRQILEQMLVLMSPYAPHIAEELWEKLGKEAGKLSFEPFPIINETYLIESSFEYPISINGKVRKSIVFPIDANAATIEKTILADETILKWLEGKTPKKVIVVPKRIVNVVV